MTRTVLSHYLMRLLLVVVLCGILPACALFSDESGTKSVREPLLQGTPLPYSVAFSVVPEGATAPLPAADHQDAADPASIESNAADAANPAGSGSALVAEMRANSQLVLLQGDPPDSRVGLERRILSDSETALKLLHSQGYYNGKVRYEADWQATPVPVELFLEPGPRYVIGSSRVVYRSGVLGAGSGSASGVVSGGIHQPFPPQGAPTTLADLGLPDAAPAMADAVVAAVDKLPVWMQNRGYPFAKVEKTRYVVDHARRVLDAEVTVAAGTYAVMGKAVFTGADSVGREYLNNLVPWTPGQPWDEAKLVEYRDELQQSGLFRLIMVKPARQEVASATHEDVLPVAVALAESAPRTAGGGLKYASDVGFGVQGTWEHRNFLGNGEKLRVALPIAQDRQELSAAFSKPAFGRKDQSLLAEAAFRNEQTDAYEQTAFYSALGLERRLSPHWWASVRLSGEGGTLDQGEGRKSYFLVGMPLSLRRDTTDSLLNPTRGTRMQVTATPYVGAWNNAFSTLRLRVDGSAYYAPFDGDGLVLAARGAVGSMAGAVLNDIPGSIRFYAGGGGSVRGYKYQSLGARNAKGDPSGGLSFNEISLEARFKITETIGLVPFVDGGMVYDGSALRLGENMAWAVGLGLRYYTPIGPVRVDFAVPLDDRERQNAFQFYVSIGQAF